MTEEVSVVFLSGIVIGAALIVTLKLLRDLVNEVKDLTNNIKAYRKEKGERKNG